MEGSYGMKLVFGSEAIMSNWDIVKVLEQICGPYIQVSLSFSRKVQRRWRLTDSKLAINQIQIVPCHNSPYKALIEDAKFLLKTCNCSLQHTLREGNRCAYKLANMGVAQDEHVVLLEDPPEEVKALVIDDITGVCVERD
ncbi:hypothetical protein ACSBR2_015487 [Camellia fascicularis]